MANEPGGTAPSPTERTVAISQEDYDLLQKLKQQTDPEQRTASPKRQKLDDEALQTFVESLATRGIEWMDLDPALRHLLKTDPEARKDFQQVQLTPDQARAYDPSKKEFATIDLSKKRFFSEVDDIISKTPVLEIRIAILKLATKPFPISLFSVYAPSQVSCEQEDLDRKEAFWRSLHEWYMHFSPHTCPIIMGDFNTRLYANQLEGLDRHIGPVTFSPPTEADLAQNNFTYMLQFLVQNDLCIISSMRPRPPSKLITYREIADLTNDPTRPTIGNFAVLDHVVTPFQYRTFFRSILSVPSLPLPWFHRHYLLTAKFVAPDFVHKDPPAAPPAFLPPSTSQKHAFQSVVLQYFQESSSLATPQV